MEEKVQMGVIKNESKEAPKEEVKELTYEQLKGVAHQLSEQGERLYKENLELKKALEQANLANLFKRLDYLFKIVGEDNPYLSQDFKTRCGQEIEQMMSAPEPESESQE